MIIVIIISMMVIVTISENFDLGKVTKCTANQQLNQELWRALLRHTSKPIIAINISAATIHAETVRPNIPPIKCLRSFLLIKQRHDVEIIHIYVRDIRGL
jgi:hypothetical protein